MIHHSHLRLLKGIAIIEPKPSIKDEPLATAVTSCQCGQVTVGLWGQEHSIPMEWRISKEAVQVPREALTLCSPGLPLGAVGPTGRRMLSVAPGHLDL